MRCFFIRGGHVVAAEELAGMTDEEAIAKAHVLFSERKNHFEGFEVWDKARMLWGHPHLTAPEIPASGLSAGSPDNSGAAVV
jgi:hypothetical protein